MSGAVRRGGYGSTSMAQNPCTVENADLFDSEAAMMHHNINELYITQIRQHTDANGPVRANFQIARSRRRPIVRTKSESDFSALQDEDVQRLRERMLRRYASSHPRFPLKGLPKLSRQQLLVLASIALVDFTSFCAMSILAPFFPSEATNKGVPTSISGFVFSIYALVVFLASPMMGTVVGYVGPKFLLITGIFLGGSCNILFGLLDRVQSTVVFIAYCFIVRIFEALGAAAFATASYTFVAELFPDKIGAVLGILETFVGLGLSVGPALGGFLYDWGGYGLPFYSLGVLMLATIPINLYLLPRTEYDEDAVDQQPSSMWKMFKVPSIVVICLVVIVASNTWGFLDPTLEPHLREFNLSAKQLGLFFLLSSFLYAVSSPFWGFVADKLTRTWILMVIGLMLSSIALLLLGPSPILGLQNTIWMNIVALIIMGTAMAMTLLPTFEAILDFALESGYRDDTSTYGLIAGLWSSMYSLGEVIGPSLGGFLLDHFGFPICATVMSAISMMMAVIVLIYFLAFHSFTSIGSVSASEKEKLTETSDSGISDHEHGSPSFTSSATLEQSKMNVELLIEVDEQTPLLARSLDRLDFHQHQVTSHEDLENSTSQSFNTTSTDPINVLQVPCTDDNDNSFTHSASFPEVLKTVGFTADGAVEI